MKESIAEEPARRAESPPVIYLVDDEEVVLNLAELALSKTGALVKKFHDPETALRSFITEIPKPTLLVTDYAMGPSMNGLDLAAACKRLHPGLKIILVSGTVGLDVTTGAPFKLDEFVQKPFTLPQLHHIAQSVLET